MGIWTPSNTCFRGPTRVHDETGFRSIQLFCTAQCRVSLGMSEHAVSPQSCLFPCGAPGAPSNTWFIESTRLSIPNGISIGSAVFAELCAVTDRPTDDATRSVTIGHIYVRSTAMRPKNETILQQRRLTTDIVYRSMCITYCLKEAFQQLQEV